MTRRKPPPTCGKPDRDVPGIVCGYPLPCPWHTVTIERGKTTVPHGARLSPAGRRRVRELAAALNTRPPLKP